MINQKSSIKSDRFTDKNDSFHLKPKLCNFMQEVSFLDYKENNNHGTCEINM